EEVLHLRATALVATVVNTDQHLHAYGHAQVLCLPFSPCRSLQPDVEMPGGWNASSDNLELQAAGIIVPVIFSLIFLLGTVGNRLALPVLRNGQVKYTSTNFFLNLAMANLCFIICCVPFQGTIYTLDGWLFGAFACKAVHFLIYLTMYASSFTLAAVSIDR
uniref:G-protein coupled receptors family 1 profile domain-containing protein n=1 Tax=Strix occidentalis caurina TaxID=311401 RepID=A0A8D0EUZ1_STROC